MRRVYLRLLVHTDEHMGQMIALPQVQQDRLAVAGLEGLIVG